MSNETTRLNWADVMRAGNFAAGKHCSQRRKGEAQEPYVNHLLEVADLLTSATGGEDPLLVCAGLLHDTLEDTQTTRDELIATFGPEVAEIVGEVTDDKSLPKETRKEQQVEHAAHASSRARMIKIADKISNLRAILTTPPRDWSDERKREYFDWAARVVANCRGLNEPLEAQFDAVYREGKARFG